jgi:hypothetical protein
MTLSIMAECCCDECLMLVLSAANKHFMLSFAVLDVFMLSVVVPAIRGHLYTQLCIITPSMTISETDTQHNYTEHDYK